MAAPIVGWPLRRPRPQISPALERQAIAVGAMRRTATGFTLLEVLVVVFLIGIVLSLAVLSVGHNEDRALKDEARRLAALIELARQESIVESLEMALAIDDRAYSFQMFDGQNWLPVADDPILRARELPDEMELDVEIDGQLAEMMKKAADAAAQAKEEDQSSDSEEGAQDANADGERAKRDQADKSVMRIFLLSSGEMTPFEIVVRYVNRDDGYTVTGNAIGEIAVAARKGDDV